METPAATSIVPLRQSKRRRAQVSYYEGESDSDIDSAYMSGSEDDLSTPKARPDKRARKEKPQNPFPFLSLPPELRNRIYELALVDPNGLVLQECWRKRRRCTERKFVSIASIRSIRPRHNRRLRIVTGGGALPAELYSLSPSILASCRQIHSEAAHVLYAQTIHVWDTMTLHHFLGPLSAPTSGLLRDIVLYSYPLGGKGVHKAMNNASMTLLRDCTGLRSLRFENGFGHPDYRFQNEGEKTGQLVARQIYRDASVWLDRIGAAKALAVLDLGKEFEADRADWQTDEQWTRQTQGFQRSRELFQEEMESLVGNKGTVKPRAVRARSD